MLFLTFYPETVTQAPFKSTQQMARSLCSQKQQTSWAAGSLFSMHPAGGMASDAFVQRSTEARSSSPGSDLVTSFSASELAVVFFISSHVRGGSSGGFQHGPAVRIKSISPVPGTEKVLRKY